MTYLIADACDCLRVPMSVAMVVSGGGVGGRPGGHGPIRPPLPAGGHGPIGPPLPPGGGGALGQQGGPLFLMGPLLLQGVLHCTALHCTALHCTNTWKCRTVCSMMRMRKKPIATTNWATG